MKTLFLTLLMSLNASAMEVVRHDLHRKIELRIVRAEPDSFETYSLTNENGREMILVCAGNRVYDENPKAMIEYRNYYNEIVGFFTIPRNEFCLEMGRFIQGTQAMINHENPFIITLDTKSMKVTKLVYPKLDPFADKGSHQDLLPKQRIFVPDNTPLVRKPQPRVH